MDKLRCIIVDDEPLALDLLERYVTRTPSLELLQACSSAMDAYMVIGRLQPDLVFLDIQMPQLDGIALSQLITNKAMVIFTTAFERYALDGFRVDAVDYLLKPINYTEFLRAVQKAFRRAGTDESLPGGAPVPVVKEASAPQSLFLKSEAKMVHVILAHIQYLEADGDYVRLYRTSGTSPLICSITLKELESLLPTADFVRVHRSYIVNLRQIETVERNVIPFGLKSVPISESYKEVFYARLNKN